MALHDETLVLTACAIDWPTREIRREEAPSGRLTATEARLLRFMAEHPGRHVSSSELLSEVWGYREGVRSRTVVVTMHRLRSKVEGDPKQPVHLLSERGGGYRFVPLGFTDPTSERTNLPASPDTLVGRKGAVDEVVAALAEGGLVTITGPAGVGKTRLALEAGRSSLGSVPGGIWWVEIRACRSALDVMDRVREALALGPSTDRPLGEQIDALGRVLDDRGACILVLDNAESCTVAAREVVDGLLTRVPTAGLLVTSRAPLGHLREVRIALEPLGEQDAVTLLQLRATGSGDDASALSALTARLDGLPLALELAARRLPALGADGLLRLLDDRLQLLRGDDQRLGLGEALDLSWEVLDEEAREALAALAGFPGDFSLDDALEVLGALSPSAFAPDVILSLVEASLVGVRTDASGRRYQLLEAVRDYAVSKDDGAGSQAFVDGLRRRAVAAREALGTQDEAEAMAWLSGHVDALRSAWDRAEDRDAVTDLVLSSLPVFTRQGRPRLAAEGLERVDAIGPATDEERRFALAVARLAVLLDLGRVDEVRRRAEQVLEASRQRGSRAFVEAATRTGLVHRRLGDLERADAELTEAVDVAEGIGDLRLLARARLELGVVQRQRRSTEVARATLEQARKEARLAGDPRTEAIAIGTLGVLHQRAGRRDESLGDLREARRLAASLGDRQSVEILDNNIAGLLILRGEHEEALQTYARLTDTLRKRGATRSLAFAHTNRGILYNRIGDTRRGEASLREALACFESLALSRGVGACHCQLARMRLSSGDWGSALQHCEAALEVSAAEASIRAQARLMILMARAARGETFDATALDEEPPAEVAGLVTQARAWVAEPTARAAIRRALLAGD